MQKLKMADCSTREVITLQFGHYSNFVGTHWWNLQESSFCYDPSASITKELNHDCLFREGVTLNGQETYTPRLLLFDLKGSLRNLPIAGSLYHSPPKEDDIGWEGQLSVHRSSQEPKNEFQIDIDDESMLADETSTDPPPGIGTGEEVSDSQQGPNKVYDIDKDVLFWSDYLGTQLHPRTINLVGEYLHDAETFPFDVFGYGQGLYKEGSLCDQFEDGLHFFAEECDRLQGFQILTDVHNGFGGLTSRVLEEIVDEYKSKSFLTVGFIPATFPSSSNTRVAHRILNMALSFSQLSEHSSVFSPLSLNTQLWPRMGDCISFPYLSYKGNLPYHTSAILASTLDTITIPYRLETSNACGMGDLINTVASGSRKIASASTSFPFPIGRERTLASLLTASMDSKENHLLHSITPHVRQTSHFVSQVGILRGVTPSFIHNVKQGHSAQKSMQQTKSLIDTCQSGLEMLNAYFQSTGAACANWNVNQACTVKSPFPNIFSPCVANNGLVDDEHQRIPSFAVQQVSVMSTLGTSSAIGEMLNSLIYWAKKIDIRKYHSFFESGIEHDSFNEIIEQLESQAEQYENP